jgi:hypothetical protein
MTSRLFQSYVNNPPWRQQTRMSYQALEVRGNPSKPRMLPAPKAPLWLQELITPTSGTKDAAAGRLYRRTHRSSFVDSCPSMRSTVNLDHRGPSEERGVWNLCARFEAGSMNR